MKRPFLILMLVASSAFAQLSPSGVYLGKLGNQDVVIGISRRDLVAFYYLDRVNQRTELGIGGLNANNQGTITTLLGRNVNLTVSGSTISGSLAGQNFTATLQKHYGGFSSRAFSYTGTAIDQTGYSAFITMGILPDGRFVGVSVSGGEIHAGLGTLHSNGIATVTLTDGIPLTTTFSPNDGVASGTITSPGYYPMSYVLTQAQRPPLINLSTRGRVGAGRMMTAGFVSTTGAKLLLIRAVGPGLAPHGVANHQADPAISLFLGSTQIAQNDNWATTVNAADVPTASNQVGAFALATGSKDSVLLVTLEPGQYTVQVTGNEIEGDALVEVYEIR